MFNFLVAGLEITAPRGTMTVGVERLFIHTDAELKKRFKPDGTPDFTDLLNIPSIFTNESSSDPDEPVLARIGAITRVRTTRAGYEVDYTIDLEIPPIPNAVLERLAPQLHFILSTSRSHFGDFQTMHWAVKDVDLFRVLFQEGIGRIKPTVFDLPKGPVAHDLVSVMMPFDAGFKGVYQALKQAVSDAGMRCQRADDIWDDDTIIQDVVKLIGTARVVICDLSGKNANVFYEAGIAHTLGKDVILVAQHDSDVPFDLRHIRHVRYLNNEQGLEALATKVTARLKDLTSKRG
jgi:hypothetical protein